MSAPATGAVEPWVTWDTVKSIGCTAVLPGSDASVQAVQGMLISFVSNLLWERTCRQFGQRTVTVRPLPRCTHRRRHCMCGQFDVIDLGDEPVASVDTVTIDGVALDSSAYRVDEWRWLLRIDGDSWPQVNDLAVTSGDGVFTVEYTVGLPVPPEGALVAAALVCKYANQIAASCSATPDNAISKSLEGVTIQLAPPKPGESFGIALVDDWLARFPCGQNGVGPGIFDPGRHRRLWHANTGTPSP